MSERTARRRLAAAVGVVAVVVAGVVVATRSDPGDPPSEAGRSPATSPARNGASGKVVADDAAAREPIGWGSKQPYKMAATVLGGSTSKVVSPERREILGRQLERVREVVLDIGTVAEAEKLGYVKNYRRIEGRGYEYLNWGYWSDKLDLDKPTMLVFPDDSPDSRVISVAYNVLGTREAGPPTDLPLEMIPWHYHHNLCRKGDSIIGNVETGPDGKLYASHAAWCKSQGAVFQPQLDHWMLDLWIVPGWENPWGLVSSKHPDMFSTPQAWFPDGTDDRPH